MAQNALTKGMTEGVKEFFNQAFKNEKSNKIPRFFTCFNGVYFKRSKPPFKEFPNAT